MDSSLVNFPSRISAAVGLTQPTVISRDQADGRRLSETKRHTGSLENTTLPPLLLLLLLPQGCAETDLGMFSMLAEQGPPQTKGPTIGHGLKITMLLRNIQ